MPLAMSHQPEGRSRIAILFLIGVIFLIVICNLWSRGHMDESTMNHLGATRKYTKMDSTRGATGITLAVTSCGPTVFEEFLNLVKSAILFSQHTQLRLFVFTDSEMVSNLTEQLELMAEESRDFHGHFYFEIRLAEFPLTKKGEEPWSAMFKPCAMERLFVSTLLPDEDAVIYMDADTLILSNVTDFWDHFHSMNESQLIGGSVLPESKIQQIYREHPELPHYSGEHGLHTGILLMNLTRMRQVHYTQLILNASEDHPPGRPPIIADHYLINVLANYHPEFVYPLPCDWCMRPRFCQYPSFHLGGCESAMEHGAAVLHGSQSSFTNPAQFPLFKEIYDIFLEDNLARDDLFSLYKRLTGIQFDQLEYNCFFNSSQSFFKRIKNYVVDLLAKK